jgi:hypothetical protein
LLKRCWFPLTGLLLASVISVGWVAQRGYVKGTLLSIEERTRDRVLLYQVNTPIVTQDAYLAVTVSVNGINYEGEYNPWRNKAPLPLFWKAGAPVSVRLEKHFFYLKRPDGGETKFEIVRKVSASERRECK